MLIDHHCHLDFPGFDDDRAATVARAHAAGVGLMVSISTKVHQFQKLLETLAPFPNVYCSVGTHPHNAHTELDITADDLIRLSAHPRVVAIGEAGLDYHYKHSTPEAQAEGLSRHILAARRTGLPLVIHSREADADMARMLEEATAADGPFPALLHCYTGGMGLAQRSLALGHSISFSGVITFKNSQDLRAIAAAVPLDRLLVETDSPFLAPAPHRGKRNEPAFVVETAKVLAGVKGVSLDEIADATTANVLRLFSKLPQVASRVPQGGTA
jgi:TatD DNase family protein